MSVNLDTKSAPYVVFMVNKDSLKYITEDYWTLWEAQRAQEEALRGGLAATLVNIREVATAGHLKPPAQSMVIVPA